MEPLPAIPRNEHLGTLLTGTPNCDAQLQEPPEHVAILTHGQTHLGVVEQALRAVVYCALDESVYLAHGPPFLRGCGRAAAPDMSKRSAQSVSAPFDLPIGHVRSRYPVRL
jgi:hypothetical protein